MLCRRKYVPHIVFNNIECIFKKSGIYSYFIFCENNKNKNMINNYISILDNLAVEITSLTDELEDDSFKLEYDIMKFKFRIDDNLPYNKKNNVPVCVISLSRIIKKEDIYHANFKLQKCFYENFYKKNYKLFLCVNIIDGVLYLLPKNRDIILKRSKDYYYNNIDTTIRKNMKDKYKNLSDKQKDKMKKYQKNYREKTKNNISEEKKRKNERISKKL